MDKLEIEIRNEDVQQARNALAEHVDHVTIWPNRDAVLMGKEDGLLFGAEFVHIPSRLQTLSGEETETRFNYWALRTA